MTTTQTTEATMAQPQPGTVRDTSGDLCYRATASCYPLTARCGWCGTSIICRDGTASWVHGVSRQIRCR